MSKPIVHIAPVPPEKPCIPVHHADVWMIDIESYHSTVETGFCEDILSADEMKKAERIVVADKRNQFTSSCSVLRHILSYYVKTDPRELEFAYGPAGKPLLSGIHREALLFNMSHSHGKMLLGITASGEIGIDIEKVNTQRLISKISHRKYTPSEQKLLNTHDPEETARIFCQLWTRKEAALKAAGTGLLFPMRHIDVSDTFTGQAVFILPVPQIFESITRSNWFVYDVPTFEGFCAAVSMNSQPATINIFSSSTEYFRVSAAQHADVHRRIY